MAMSGCATTPPIARGNSTETGNGACFTDDFKARLHQAVAGYADVADIPGISMGIVASGSLVHTVSVGYANRSQRTPATPDTLYNIASLTKPFTATLALMLAEEGVVRLDAPVSTYLPDTVRVPVDTAGGVIMIRHLLSHTSGLPGQPPNRRNQVVDGPIDPGIWEAYSVAQLYAALPATTLKGKVGEQFAYSNYGYALLGHVLERAAGVPYEALLRQRILGPLGMTDTAITLSPQQTQRLAAHYWSEDPDRNEQAVHARFGDVAGFIGLSSSVRDLAAFAAAHLQRAGQGDTPIPPSVRALMATPQIATESIPLFRSEMALGWFRETRLDDGTFVLFHQGEVDGHASGMFLDPATGVGVVILQNLGGDVGARGTEQLGFWMLQTVTKEMRVTTACGRSLRELKGRAINEAAYYH